MFVQKMKLHKEYTCHLKFSLFYLYISIEYNKLKNFSYDKNFFNFKAKQDQVMF